MTPDCIVDILHANGKVLCTNCRLEVLRYAESGNIAIRAICTDASLYHPSDGGDPERCTEGELWGMLTVNIPQPYPGCVCLKDYSEGEGSLRTLVRAGLVEEPEAWVRTGFVEVPVCRLTERGASLAPPALGAREVRNG